MPKGSVPGQTGVKKGYPGGVSRDNSNIGDDAFSSDWATPLNATNAGQPGPSPKQGGVTEMSDMGTIPNPMNIPNVSESGRKGK